MNLKKGNVKFSIKFKFFIVIASIICFVSINLIVFFIFKSKIGLEQEIEKRGLSEIKSLAYDAKYGVLTENKKILEDLIKGRLRKEDIVYVNIIGDEENTLAENKKTGYIAFNKAGKEVVEFEEDVYRSSLSTVEGEKIYEFVAPILTEKRVVEENEDPFESFSVIGEEDNTKSLTTKIGVVKMGISLQNVKEQMTEIFFMSILIVFVIIVVSVAVSIYFINLLVKPIKDLTITAIDISNGDLTKVADINSSDEIGVLANNFNKMTANLKNNIDELESLKNGLEIEVQKRTEDLRHANIELRTAFNDLKQLDEMKTNFVASVSHELRTPLTSVVGFSENTLAFFKKEIIPALPTDNKRIKRKTKIIEQNLSIVISEGHRLTRLINDVLDIAKMEEGTVDWNIKEVDIVAACKQALSAVAGYPKGDQVEVFFEAPEKVHLVKGDPDLLVQVIANFMSNALKFTERGSVTLKVDANDKNVKVTVSDTGAGIKNEDLDKVFEKFQQISDKIETNKPKGTGLGLSICKGIIMRLGGDIWAESKVGKGSSFCFTLNYFTEVKEKAAHQGLRIRKRIIEEIKQKAPIDIKKRSATVLIVDDDSNIRKLLHQELELETYKVMEAKNGTEALTIINKCYKDIDLVLLDVMMPGIDGFDVLSIIKTNEQFGHMPVIVVSAYEVKGKVYRLGAEDFMSKPIDKTLLLSKISSLVNGLDSKRVLVIDYDYNIIVDISASLRENGYIVNSANNGEDGFIKAKKERPDIIMLNLEIPDINKGLETLKKLHLDETTANTHIILIANKKNEDAHKIAETLKIEISEAKDALDLLKDI